MELFKKLKEIISASILCFRFPFLYPRNRWDDKYHCGLLSNYTYKLRLKARQSIIITGEVNKSDDYFSHNANFFNYHVKLDEATKQVSIRTHETEIKFDYSKLIWGDNKFKILEIKLVFTIAGLPLIKIQVEPIDESDNTNYGFTHYHEEIIINKRYEFWYKVIDWIDTKVLDKILFLPSYTELDAMEPGWRKAFGIQMCKEIKTELNRHKFLYKYRISQIKEKFGALRWYDNGVPKNCKVHSILDKYEEISSRTCGICGKPATKISKGWIYPYCDACIGDRQFIEIKQ